MTRFLGLFSVLFSLLYLAPSALAICLEIPGDVDGSGEADVVDVQCNLLAVFAFLIGEAPPSCTVENGDQPIFLAHDLDCNEEITVSDTLLVIKLVIGIGLPVSIDLDGNSCADSCEEPCLITSYDDCGEQGAPCLKPAPSSTSCSDGDPCTEGDYCSGVDTQCLPSNLKDCSDGDQCTVDTCNSFSGQCDNFTSNGTSCDDGDACTEQDTCLGGLCIGTQIDCDDDNPCTADSCSQGDCFSEAQLNGLPCFDGLACTDGDTCQDGVCEGFVDTDLCSGTLSSESCSGIDLELTCPPIDPWEPVESTCLWCATGGNVSGTHGTELPAVQGFDPVVEQITSEAVHHPISVSMEAIYYATQGGQLIKRSEADDGVNAVEVYSTKKLSNQASPAVGEEIVLFTFRYAVMHASLTEEFVLLALDRETWQIKWSFGEGGPGGYGMEGGAIIVNGRVYFEYQSKTFCLEESTGQLCDGWSSESMGTGFSIKGVTPLYVEDIQTSQGASTNLVIYTTQVGRAYAVNADTGALVWQAGPSYQLGQTVNTLAGGMITSGGYFYYPDSNGTVWCFSLSDGNHVQHRNLYGNGIEDSPSNDSEPIRQIAQHANGFGGQIVVATQHDLFVMDQNLYGVIPYHFPDGISAGPVISANGDIYIATDSHVLVLNLYTHEWGAGATLTGQELSLGDNAFYLSIKTTGGVWKVSTSSL